MMMNFTLLSSIMTIISLVVFLGIMYWAFSARNKARFEEIGRLDNDPDLDDPPIKQIKNRDGQ
jgi:cytochrome c oxidase cbb3-type subunit 4